MKQDESVKKFNGLIIVLLFICLVIYIFYRPEGTLINIILNSIFSQELLLSFKESVRSAVPLNNAYIYSLPGGLWVFCATLLSYKLRTRLFQREINLEWLPVAFAVWLEVGQLIGLVKGRFDLMDLTLVVLFFLLAKIFLGGSGQKQLSLALNRRSFKFILGFICVFMAHVF